MINCCYSLGLICLGAAKIYTNGTTTLQEPFEKQATSKHGRCCFQERRTFCSCKFAKTSAILGERGSDRSPHKQTILGWLTGVRIEEFLNSFTSTTFQEQTVQSYYPQPREFENYVPPEFQNFMNEQVQEWVNLGVLRRCEEVRSGSDSLIPTVVSPLG